MVRTIEYGTAISMLAATFALVLPGGEYPVKSQVSSELPDIRQIVDSSIATTQRHWKARIHYTYIERDESRHEDSNGRVKSQDVEDSRMILVNGVPFEQLMERNGKPLSVEEQRKQNEKLDELKRETPEQHAERVRIREDESASLVREIPKAFDFRLVGEEAVNGRPAYVLQATPHPRYQAQGKYGRLFSKVEGKLWIDKQDLALIKIDGQVIQPFSIGLFLVRLLRGSEIKMEQTRLGDGIWMPERVEVRAAAKIFFLKTLVIYRTMNYSDYNLPQSGGPGIRGPVIP
ncbi:MAG: hypothetical protein WCE61_23525 [Candidatus Acidiferrum sp.]